MPAAGAKFLGVIAVPDICTDFEGISERNDKLAQPPLPSSSPSSASLDPASRALHTVVAPTEIKSGKEKAGVG